MLRKIQAQAVPDDSEPGNIWQQAAAGDATLIADGREVIATLGDMLSTLGFAPSLDWPLAGAPVVQLGPITNGATAINLERVPGVLAGEVEALR